ncbi:aldo/keto reductase [Propionivibrio sp.]|uniref:aldo/keto reductase n=1 Tax=Propionivibrio sp. TaxID=2212460 RepID=UPI002602433C|nr:aldo/keto reductase [Propionivibrio sp.]
MSQGDKLGLGTVQWGLPYGISGEKEITPPQTVAAILTEAQRVKIRVLDTAVLYGESERVLGSNCLDEFDVVTKTPRFATSVITDDDASRITKAFSQSLEKLSTKNIYGLLLHHANDLLVPGGTKLLAAMMALKEKGAVEKIGVSVYDAEQIDAVLKVFTPDIVQLPISVLDQRLLTNGRLDMLKSEGVEIHARSVFLQGLLLMPLRQVPAYFDPIRPLLSMWHSAAEVQGMTLAQAALSYVRDIVLVDTVLVGVESLEQFRACLSDFFGERTFNAAGLSCHAPEFVNPALWNLS